MGIFSWDGESEDVAHDSTDAAIADLGLDALIAAPTFPATAQVGKRLAWAEVVASGPNVRSMEVGDQVLFNPEDRYEVEVRGKEFIILRERDIHAVAAPRLEEGSTGLYL